MRLDVDRMGGMRVSTNNILGPSLEARLSELGEACRILAMEGHGNMTLGHLSLRDPDGRGVWMKRRGISLGEVRGPEDFLLIADDGAVLAGSGAHHAEWPIHTEVYRSRPEIHAIAHTYPFYGSVIGATAAPIMAVTREACYFDGRVARYSETSNLITTPELGRGLAGVLGPHYAVLMHNHGVAFCGRSTAECVVVGIMLERVCKAIVVLNGTSLDWSPAREAAEMQPEVGVIPEHETARFWNYFRRKLARSGGPVPSGVDTQGNRNII